MASRRPPADADADVRWYQLYSINFELYSIVIIIRSIIISNWSWINCFRALNSSDEDVG